MILLEVRGPGIAFTLHPRITVVRGLDPASRRQLVDGLARVFAGETATFEVVAEVEGRRIALPGDDPADVKPEAGGLVSLRAADLPGARPRPPAGPPAEESLSSSAERSPTAADEEARAAADGSVALAEAALADARASFDAAEQELRAAELADEQGGVLGADGVAALDAAQRRLQEAEDEAANARRALAAGRTAQEGVQDEQASGAGRRAQQGRRVEELTALVAELESRRAELVDALVDVGEPGDPEMVRQALARVETVRAERDDAARRAQALADRWAELRRRERDLPPSPEPPEWLLSPALAARDEAREALARVDAGGAAAGIDTHRVEEVERAHREVLDAEQRVMRKATRQARRRLEQAEEAEAKALEALGAASYRDYLQRIVPLLEDDRSGEERVAQARRMLSDAEAVLEELYSGAASPERVALAEEVTTFRAEVAEALGVLPPDAEIEAALSSHAGTAVAEAEAALREALRAAGVDVADDREPAAAARDWLELAPEQRNRRAELEAELATVAARLAATQEELGEHRADAFFGSDADAVALPTPNGALDALEDAVHIAESAVDDAQEAVATARQRVEEDERAAARGDAAATGVEDARSAWEDTRRRLAAAEEGLEATRRAAADAAEAADAARAGPAPVPDTAGTAASAVDLSSVRPLEAEIFLLARLAALRSAGALGPLPLVVDADVLDLPEPATRRLLALLARASATVQTVVVADSEVTEAWARSLAPDVSVVHVRRAGTAA